VIAVEAFAVHVGRLALGLSAEVLLGERWALIGSVRLLADHEHPAVEPLLP
jgi:hypothetical protein